MQIRRARHELRAREPDVIPKSRSCSFYLLLQITNQVNAWGGPVDVSSQLKT